jgi:hypothetical protein
MSFRSIGSIAVNEPAAWAQGSDWEGKKAKQFDNAALQREILDLDVKIERLEHDIQLDEEHLRRSPSTDAREQAARNALIAAKKDQFESMKARRELQKARLDAAESGR